jgi:PKD repeat protein
LVGLTLATGSCSDQFEPTPSLPSAEVSQVSAPVILVGAGDIASCTNTGDSKTALLVESILNANPTAWAFIAGDNVYEDGSSVEYRDCYGPTWGRFKARTRPSLGNHEYDGVEGATPSFDYFGDALWENSRDRGGYYSFNLGDTWHIVVLNSNEPFVPAIVGGAQDTWLKADLAANNRPCIGAIFHHPRFFSSTDTASTLSRGWVKPFWDALYAAGADFILNGHAHQYERFAPQTPDGVADPQTGIRQFIVGMGGKSISVPVKIASNSEVRNGDTFGVMELTLNASSYSWRYVPEAGKSFTDTGTNNCHNPFGGVETNIPPSAAFSQTCSGLNCAFKSDASSDSDGIISSRGWQFGDGATSTQANPAHAYATAGTYTVNLTVTDDDGATNTVSHSVQVGSPPGGGGAVLVGAGDIAHCSLASDEATAKLLDALPGATVFTLGDNANSVGSATDFTNCYEPTWGRHKARTRPIPGYMDYKTTGATGYYGYFGSAAGPSGQGYYSYNLGDWHIVALNSMVSMSAGSAQEQWLRADLAANPKVCTLAYIARARFSSGKNGGASSVQPLWQALYERGADIILAGSDHSYERFARQTPAGAANPGSGIQQFVVGTGGQSLTGLVALQPNSVVFNGSTFGVLKLTLGATGYSWEFVPVAGSTFTDAGSMDCVGAPPPVPNVAPVANFTQACTGLSCTFTDASTDSDGSIKSRSWEFGDGAISTAANPTHAFATGGTYSVKLTVTDDDDALSQPVTQSVTVAPIPNSPPTAAFEPNCQGLDCDFDNSSLDADGTIVAWSWDFGDHGPGSTSDQPAPSHSYAEAGTYTVTLTVTDDDGADSGPVSHEVTVAEPLPNVAPTAAFSAPTCTA